MSPIVDGVAQEYPTQLTVQRVNALTDNGLALMRQYQIPGHPVVLIIDRNGQEVARLVGLQSAEAIEQTLQPVLP